MRGIEGKQAVNAWWEEVGKKKKKKGSEGRVVHQMITDHIKQQKKRARGWGVSRESSMFSLSEWMGVLKLLSPQLSNTALLHSI